MKNCFPCKFLALLISLALALPAVAQDDKSTPPIAEPKANVVIPKLAPEAPGGLKPLSVTLHLVGGTILEGTLLNATQLMMKTSFGEANIPLNEVAGIRLAEAGNGTTTVILHNGDSISGGTELDKLDVVTVWGQAEVNGTNISSILFTQGVKWVTSTGFAGSRWTLTEEQSGTQQASSPSRTTTQPPTTYPYGIRPPGTSSSIPPGTVRAR